MVRPRFASSSSAYILLASSPSLLLLLFRRFGVAAAADTSCMSLSCKRAVTRFRLTSIVSVAGQTAAYLTRDRCGEMRRDCSARGTARGTTTAEGASLYLALCVSSYPRFQFEKEYRFEPPFLGYSPMQFACKMER